MFLFVPHWNYCYIFSRSWSIHVYCLFCTSFNINKTAQWHIHAPFTLSYCFLITSFCFNLLRLFPIKLLSDLNITLLKLLTDLFILHKKKLSLETCFEKSLSLFYDFPLFDFFWLHSRDLREVLLHHPDCAFASPLLLQLTILGFSRKRLHVCRCWCCKGGMFQEIYYYEFTPITKKSLVPKNMLLHKSSWLYPITLCYFLVSKTKA